MNKTIVKMRDILLSNQDLVYKKFTANLSPSIPQDEIIGVRLPVIRQLAKEMKQWDKRDVNFFLDNLPHKYLEENKLHAILINELKDFNECMERTEEFLPHIHDWSVCDILKPKAFINNEHLLIKKIYSWLESSREYTLRFAILCLMNFYMGENFNKSFPTLIANIHSYYYYVMMMKAWYFSQGLASRYDDFIFLLEEKLLDEKTHKTTIQKCVDSYKIPREKKEYLKSLR